MCLGRCHIKRWDDLVGDSRIIELRMDAWKSELQIDLGWHLQDATLAEGAAWLNDRRMRRYCTLPYVLLEEVQHLQSPYLLTTSSGEVFTWCFNGLNL